MGIASPSRPRWFANRLGLPVQRFSHTKSNYKLHRANKFPQLDALRWAVDCQTSFQIRSRWNLRFDGRTHSRRRRQPWHPNVSPDISGRNFDARGKIMLSGSASGHDSIHCCVPLPCAVAVWVVRVMVRSRVRGYSRARPRGPKPLAAPTLGRCRHKTNITLCLCQLSVGRSRQLAGFRLLVAIRDLLGLRSQRFALPLSLILSSDAPSGRDDGDQGARMFCWFSFVCEPFTARSRASPIRLIIHQPSSYAMFQNHQPERNFPTLTAFLVSPP
jgi:hypothetical protein